MWTIFLDIDGTLLRTNGAGMTAIRNTLHEYYEVDRIPRIEPHGRTDRGILIEILGKLGLAIPDDFGELLAGYCRHLDLALSQAGSYLLPGVEALLQKLSLRDDVALGLLTGNAATAAAIKLRLFGLDRYVRGFGGYGDHAVERNQVATDARVAARQFLKDDFDENQMWVVGDTVDDIRCGRSIGARVMTVETGGSSRQELLGKFPDLHFRDLSDSETVISRMLNAQRSGGTLL